MVVKRVLYAREEQLFVASSAESTSQLKFPRISWGTRLACSLFIYLFIYITCNNSFIVRWLITRFHINVLYGRNARNHAMRQ